MNKNSCRRAPILIVIRFYSEFWIINQIVYAVHENLVSPNLHRDRHSLLWILNSQPNCVRCPWKKLVAELRARSPFVFDVRMVFNSFLVLNSKILIVSCTIRQFDRISAPNLSLENWRMTLEKGATRKCENFKARVSGGNQPEWNSLSQDSC